MKISIQSFNGVSPRTNPRYLPDGAAQIALNVESVGQSVRPMKGLSAPLVGPVLEVGAKTVYRAGLNAPSEASFWLSWPTDVDVCRAQIAGDPEEWHFWTGDATPSLYPKAGCAGTTINGKSPPYPGDNHVRLGLPAPVNAPNGAVSYAAAEKRPAKLVLTPAIMAQFTTFNFQTQSCDFQGALDRDPSGNYRWYYPLTINSSYVVSPTLVLTAANIAAMSPAYGLKLSLDNETNITDIDLSALTTLTAINVAAAINAQALIKGLRFVTATTQTSNTEIKLVTNVAGGPLRFVVRWGADDYTQRLIVNGTPLTALAVKSAMEGTWRIVSGTASDVTGTTLLTLTVDGGNLIVETKAPYVGGGSCSIPPWDTKESCEAAGTCSIGGYLTKATCEAVGGTWSAVWTPAAFLALRWGTESYQQLTAYGTTENKGTLTSHTYIYTWVATPGRTSVNPAGFGLTMESAPSPASPIINVYSDSTVLMWTFNDPDGAGTLPRIFPTGSTVEGTAPNQYLRLPGDYIVHGIRLYRAVSGSYLLVEDENVLTISKLCTIDTALVDVNGGKYYCYKDEKDSDALGEPCPSILWSEPPADLKGLINLPNGVMAGFLNRDVYMCEPYRPYAWPESYINTLDYKIVGLGRMDTTLAVLTDGAPYFIQGSSPETMVVVKGDLEQSCVSKRSIVSMGGVVLYASPDGLIMLTPGGSQILTDQVFDRAAWQALLGATPASTFHAYGHDNKYIAFHQAVTETFPNSPSVTYTGFVADLRAKQFYRHNLTCDAAYQDLLNDYLYLAQSGQLRKWGEGARVNDGRWRSKRFSMPQITGFSCAQVEAESYSGLKCAVYCDSTKVASELTSDELSTTTQSRLEGRYPFRLGARQGRDWEIDLAVTQEVFNVVVAQSMSEIASS